VVESSSIVISDEQEEVLRLLQQDYLTVNQIAQRRNTSNKAVYKILSKLKKKGLFRGGLKQGVEKSGVTNIHQQKSSNMIRLHNEQFNIQIQFKGNSFIDKEGQRITIDNNTVSINRDSIDIYSNQSFYGKDVDEVEKKAVTYWDRIFNILENDLNVLFLKDRKHNIKRVRAHYSETNNEMAKVANKEGEKISIKTTEDGKEWLKVDNSLNLNEMETVHPKTAKEDMREVIQPFFTELRANPYFLRDFKVAMIDVKDSILLIGKLQAQGAELMKETAAATLNIMKLITPAEDKKEQLQPQSRADYIG